MKRGVGLIFKVNPPEFRGLEPNSFEQLYLFTHLYGITQPPRELTKKEIIENGWVEKYVLGLTTEEESSEVERLATLYPEVQESINLARNKICSKFNRSLTQPALRNTFMNKRRMMALTIALVSLFSLGFCLLCREHFSLQANYIEQSQKLAFEQAKMSQLVSYTNERSIFLHSPSTRRIRLKGCGEYPDAEVMVFQCIKTGRMMLRVIDLPELQSGQRYEVWAQQPDQQDRLIGQMHPPVRFDSLYVMEDIKTCSSLQINSVDPSSQKAIPVCLASLR